MDVILNIGLDAKATPSIASHVALEIVKANGFLVRKHAVHRSDTEQTLVVVGRVDPTQSVPLLTPVSYRIALDLQQDCIAVWRTNPDQGRLIGPRAARWGAFDPALFIMPDGRRLSEHNHRTEDE